MQKHPLPGILFIEWSALLSGIGLLTVTEVYQPYVLLGAGLLVAAFVLRAVRTRCLLPHTGLEIPAIIFLLSAAIATWVAYDRPAAFLQFLRLFAAAVLFTSLADSRSLLPIKVTPPISKENPPQPNYALNQDLPDYRIARLVAAGFSLAAAFLAVYWPLGYNFTQDPAKFGSINQLGLFIDNLPLSLPGPDIHPNVAAGTLALAVPVAAFLTWEFWRLSQTADTRQARAIQLAAASITALATLFIITGLLLTSSRGAWLGIAAAAGLALFASIQWRWFSKPRQKTIFWVALLSVSLALGILIGLSADLGSLLGKIPDPTGSLQDRPRVWAQALPLVRDYFFTGSGLMSFYWQYPVYGLLGHVGIFAHIHNFLLEIWIEQGFLGLLAALWMGIVLIGWGWRALGQAPDPSIHPPDQTWLGFAGLASLVVVAVHGIVDVLFYVERTLPVLGLAVGLAALSTPYIPEWSRMAVAPAPKTVSNRRRPFLRQNWPILVVSGLVVVAILLPPGVHRTLISMAYANLGALRQAALELPQFSRVPFSQQTLDQIRQTSDLSKAQTAFQTALVWDSHNLTALQRTASIALSSKDYPQALAILQQAWGAGFRDENTRLLYSDALVANGQIEQAASLVRGILSAEDRLMYQAWYRYTLQNDLARAVAAWKTVLIINPENQQAVEGLEDALQRNK